MKAAQRRKQIADLARANGPASVDELAERFGVSASTIRRDLARLDESEGLARTYGGIISVPRLHTEAALAERALIGTAAKQKLGRWAASQVRPGQTVLVDAGTTAAQVALYLRRITPLTVVTAGLTPFFELSGAVGIERILLGGSLRELSQGFVGPLTEEALERWSIDLVFLGADAVTADRGVCEASVAQTRLKQLMARSGDRVYLLVHAEKIGQRPFNSWIQLPGGWTLVTDDEVTDEQLAPFRSRGIEVVVVGGLDAPAGPGSAPLDAG